MAYNFREIATKQDARDRIDSLKDDLEQSEERLREVEEEQDEMRRQNYQRWSHLSSVGGVVDTERWRNENEAVRDEIRALREYMKQLPN